MLTGPRQALGAGAVLEAREAARQLTQDLGCAPIQAEMARHLGVSGNGLGDAQRAQMAFQPSSLKRAAARPARHGTQAGVLGEEDWRVEQMFGIQAVAAHWGELPPREQLICCCSFATT